MLNCPRCGHLVPDDGATTGCEHCGFPEETLRNVEPAGGPLNPPGHGPPVSQPPRVPRHVGPHTYVSNHGVQHRGGRVAAVALVALLLLAGGGFGAWYGLHDEDGGTGTGGSRAGAQASFSAGDLPPPTATETFTIGRDGQRWDLSNVSPAMRGAAIEFPIGALDTGTQVTASLHQGEAHLPEGFDQVYPTIHLDAGSDDPFSRAVSLGFDVSGEARPEAVTLLYRADGDDEWDVANHVVDGDSVRGVTMHFSAFALVRDTLSGGRSEHSTGFDPKADGFRIVNYADYSVSGGNCLGMSAYAAWYFREPRADGADGLFQSYGSDHEQAVVAARAHLAQGTLQVWTAMTVLADRLFAGNPTMGQDLFYSDHVKRLLDADRLPVVVLFGPDSFVGHAVLAIGYDQDSISIYDPNHPGITKHIAIGPSGFFEPYEGMVVIGAGSTITWGFENIHSDTVAGHHAKSNINLQIDEGSGPQELNDDREVPVGAVDLEGTLAGHLGGSPRDAWVYVGTPHPTKVSVRPDGSFTVDNLPIETSKTGRRTVLVLMGDGDPERREGTYGRVLDIRPIGTQAVTVTLTWRDDASASDVDLYILEPGGEAVWYVDMEASSGGELDRDDMDGEGPEHYTLNAEEGDTVESGWYKIRVHYFAPHGADEIYATVVVQLHATGGSESVDLCIAESDRFNDDPTDDGPDWRDVGMFRISPEAEIILNQGLGC